MSTGGKTSSKTPNESGKRPLSSAQGSGKTQFGRMTTAKKVGGEGGENLKNGPKVH